jgi:hypothetical protein
LGSGRGVNPDAVALSRGQTLAIGVSDLKQQIAKRQGQAAPPSSVASGFVEVPRSSTKPQTWSGMEVELYRPDGARLRLQAPETSLPLVAIVQSFLEAR